MKTKKIIILVFIMLVAGKIFSQTILPEILNCSTVLTIAESPYLALTDLTVQNGCSLVVEPGVEIKMANNVHLIIKGKAEFLGTADFPIHILGQTTTWGQIFIDSSLAQHSVFNYVIIEGATHGPDGDSHFSTVKVAALTSYYSSVEVNNCLFKNNKKSIYSHHGTMAVKNCIFDSTNNGEKILIQFTDSAIVENNTFYYTQGTGDAVDFDGLNKGTIQKNLFYGGDADAVDIGQRDGITCTNILIKENFIRDFKDKGISNGEGAENILIEKNTIIRCGTGIGVKDNSLVFITGNTLNRDSLGINCYDWFIGNGGGRAYVKNTIITNSIISSLYKDSTAILEISYSLSNTDTLNGTGNLFDNPLYSSITNDDYHLTLHSPCIDKGDPGSSLDPDGSPADIGAFYFNKNSTSISEFITDNNKIYLSPNPANDLTNLKYHVIENTDLVLQLSNLNGTVILEETYSNIIGEFNLSIDLSQYSSGIYLVRIVTNQTQVNKKIILL